MPKIKQHKDLHNSPSARKRLGVKGEDEACDFLLKNGYGIVTRNFSCKIGEIDIIASKGEYLCFVEVKTRRSLKYGLPCEAVNKTKQEKIRKAAMYYWCFKTDKRLSPRFDIAEILHMDGKVYIRYMENAF